MSVVAQPQGAPRPSVGGRLLIVDDDASFGQRLANAVLACAGYLQKTLLPSGLSVFYPYRADVAGGELALAVGILVVASAVCLAAPRRRGFAAVGWLWFLGTLVPVSGLVQVGKHASADRYTYVTLVGVFVALVWGSWELAGRRPSLRRPLLGLGALALGLCALLSARQVRVWSDTETLFRHALAVTEGNGLAHNVLGKALAMQGRDEEALEEFRAAVEIFPRYAEAHENLGQALAQAGRGEEAIGAWRRAIELDPRSASARNRLGAALVGRGRSEEGIGLLREALSIDPADPYARNNLASALARAGRFEGAAREYRALLERHPERVESRVYLARCLRSSGHAAEGLDELRRAARSRPDDGELAAELADWEAEIGP